MPPVTLLLTEFLCSNDRGIRDDDGDRSDWIEIHNPSEDAVSLAGWSLTDDASNLAQWRFPAVTLPRRGYLLVWASGKNRTGIGTPLHTSFRLSDGGEYLVLVDPETNVVSAFAPVYPVQRPDISYGRDAADPSVVGYFPTPQPGGTQRPGGTRVCPGAGFFDAGRGVYQQHADGSVVGAVGRDPLHAGWHGADWKFLALHGAAGVNGQWGGPGPCVRDRGCFRAGLAFGLTTWWGRA